MQIQSVEENCNTLICISSDEKKMFVSGNPTLPSKIPWSYRFFLDFWKNILKTEKSVKTIYFPNFFKEKKKYRPTLSIFLDCYPKQSLFLLGLSNIAKCAAFL